MARILSTSHLEQGQKGLNLQPQSTKSKTMSFNYDHLFLRNEKKGEAPDVYKFVHMCVRQLKIP